MSDELWLLSFYDQITLGETMKKTSKKINASKAKRKKKAPHIPMQCSKKQLLILENRPQTAFNRIENKLIKSMMGADKLVGNEETPNPFLRQAGAPPAHYAHGKIEPWAVIKDWNLDYFCGNASKYICRHKHKGTPVQDIKKAIDCLQEYAKVLEANVK